VLIAFRFLLGFGVGGDYPVSAVLMSEYANRKDRGRLEFAAFQAGDHHGAVTASLGPDRALRKTYEQSLARAQALGANSIQSARSSVAAASSRSVTILVACLLAALTIGVGVALWLVRAIAMPVARLVAILGGDLPS
jgi:MFS family permease